MRSSLPTAALALLVSTSTVDAQRYRREISNECLVRFDVVEGLGPVPLKLGTDEVYLRAKFGGGGNSLDGSFSESNYVHLLEFRKDAEGKPITNLPPDIDLESLPPEIRRTLEEQKPFGTWEDFIRSQVSTFAVEGKKGRTKAKTQPEHTLWEWKDPERDYRWYSFAACYQVDDNRQVVLVTNIPTGAVADRRNCTNALKMISSLRVIDEDEAEELGINANRDKYADTDAKRTALLEAKKHIQSLSNWDYFTTPNYIVLFSWDHRNARADLGPSLRFAKQMAKMLEQCREHYQERFPPHDQMLDVYSILRVCYTRTDFEKYGDTPLGVVGWFNPSSKELVIFNDREEVYGDEQSTVATLFHEGWHQYGHTYFGEDTLLHRWFDEGTGDFFGSHRRAGRRWKHAFDDGRCKLLGQMVPRESYVPLRELVTWNTDKFYGPGAVNHYAQGYALVEFLDKGKKVLGKRFDDSWSEIYTRYITAMLETKDQQKAVEIAFADIDWDAFESAWVDFVKRAML